MGRPGRLSPLQMEYRDKTYVVARGLNSPRWDWAVELDAGTVRGGRAASKQAAIKAAERLIDSALAPTRQRLTLVGPCGEERS